MKPLSQKYGAIHAYVRKHKLKPELCVRCNERPATDAANISQEYKRDFSDWEYLCRKCHMDGDGRSDILRQSGKSRKLPDKTCPYCGIKFHSDKRDAKFCSHTCALKFSWKTVRKLRPPKPCIVCKVLFINKQKKVKTCSRKCASKLLWEKRKIIIKTNLK